MIIPDSEVYGWLLGIIVAIFISLTLGYFMGAFGRVKI
jgi:hypothetical protein